MRTREAGLNLRGDGVNKLTAESRSFHYGVSLKEVVAITTEKQN